MTPEELAVSELIDWVDACSAYKKPAPEFQSGLREWVLNLIRQERERCAKVAERVAAYYSANNGDNKDVALLVAQEIREGIVRTT